jgi:hypothetical protein
MIPQSTRRKSRAGKDKSNISERFALHLPYEDLSPDLASVVAAWPNLPEPIRAGIMAMIRATSPPPCLITQKPQNPQKRPSRGVRRRIEEAAEEDV